MDCFNSKLRTVQYIKKHVSREYLWLLALKHNIEPFAHDKRKGHSPIELLGIGSMLCFSANNQRYSWLTCFLIYWTALNLLLKQSIGFFRLFLSTGEVCFQNSVRVSSPPNLAVLKNPVFMIENVQTFRYNERPFSVRGQISPCQDAKATHANHDKVIKGVQGHDFRYTDPAGQQAGNTHQ